MIATLKKAIRDSDLTYTEIQREIGVKRNSLLRFMRGETSLRLDLADERAAFFKIKVSGPKSRS